MYGVIWQPRCSFFGRAATLFNVKVASEVLGASLATLYEQKYLDCAS